MCPAIGSAAQVPATVPHTQDELRQARWEPDVEIDLGRLDGENCRLQRELLKNDQLH